MTGQQQVLRGRLRHCVALAPFTSWRVGGPADELFEPADRADLLAYLSELPPDRPLLWIGLGSNLLVRDGGFHGSVVVLRGALAGLSRESETTLYAEAGVHCARLAKFAERHELAGLGFMAGIPGTVGGALAMNAGAWGGETWRRVLEVEIIDVGGGPRWVAPAEFGVSYRTVLPPSGFLGFLAARLRVEADDGSHARDTRDWLARRRDTQPVGRPSAGSTFRNPPGDHAARLIEQCGLKGQRIGGAVVSPRHANFILNEDHASAADIEALIVAVADRVLARTGVALQTEVRIVGEPAHA